jgi:L-ascorbate metabolism protein UlaG (beta-lactamase superfamily)
VRISHFGQSCVLVELGAARLLVDPGVYSDGFEQLTGLDTILVTHQHPDHLDLTRLPGLLAANPSTPVLADPGSAAPLTDAGVSHQVVTPGQRVEVAGATVEVIGGEHGMIHPDVPVVPNNGYLISGPGGTVLHPGDGLDPPGRAVDVLLLPTAAPWLKLAEAVEYLRAVAAPVAIPIHQAILAKPGKYYTLLGELAPAGTTVRVTTHAQPLTP